MPRRIPLIYTAGRDNGHDCSIMPSILHRSISKVKPLLRSHNPLFDDFTIEHVLLEDPLHPLRCNVLNNRLFAGCSIRTKVLTFLFDRSQLDNSLPSAVTEIYPM